LIGEKNAYNEREDYSEFEGEYQGNTEAMLGEHANTINNPEMRQKFINEFRPRIAVGREQLGNVAWGKEKEFEKSELDSATTTSIDAAVLSGDDDDIATIAANAKGLIQSHFDMGWIDEAERKERTEQFNHKMAVGILESKAPEKRVEMLKQSWAKNLPASTHAKLVRESEEAMIEGQSIELVDSYIDNGLSYKEAKKDVKKLKDANARKAADQRIDYMYSKQEKEISIGRTEIYDEWFLPLRMGEKTISDMPRDQLESLSPAQQNNLIAAQSSSVSKAKTPFNSGLEDKLNILLKTKRFTELRTLYEENSANLNDAQNKTWSAVSIDGVIPPEIESLFSETASLEAKTPTLTKEQRAPIKNELIEWHHKFQDLNKRVPTDKEYTDKIDKMILEFDPSSGWFSGTKRISEMDESEKKFVLEDAKENDPKLFKDLTEFYAGKGLQPDLETFMQQYTTIKEKRDAAK